MQLMFKNNLFFFFEERARMYGNGCVSECLYNAIFVCRFWTVEGVTSSIREKDIRHHVSESSESAWGAAEARPEKVIVEVVRKGIVGGRCWNIF